MKAHVTLLCPWQRKPFFLACDRQENCKKLFLAQYFLLFKQIRKIVHCIKISLSLSLSVSLCLSLSLSLSLFLSFSLFISLSLSLVLLFSKGHFLSSIFSLNSYLFSILILLEFYSFIYFFIIL